MLRSTTALAATLLIAASAPAPAADFPPVTDAERALTAVPGFPEAPAVVLFERGHLDFMDYPDEVSSIFKIEVRLKILTDEGAKYGEVEVPHSRFYRLKSFHGRTVLADGTVVPLPEDAVFQEVSSRSQKLYLTKAAFPAVAAGAILDYAYELRWDDIYFLEPWYFNNEVPTMLSEITYVIPGDMAVQPWSRQTARQQMQTDLKKTPRGRALRVWMEDLFPVPDEPHSFPFGDLSSRIMMVPTSVRVSGTEIPILETWDDVCDLFEGSYKRFSGRDGKASKQAAALAAGAPGQRAKIDAVHAFVRDEIRLQPSFSLWADDDRSVDEVLVERQGTGVEKALVLKAMLESLKMKPQVVWAPSRWEGRVDLSVANPWWFERALVMVEVDGGRLFLDPSERSLAAGRLPPYVEGQEALVVSRKKHEILTLPETPFDDSTRRARLELALGEDGAVRGGGSLVLTGHHAWRRLRWKEDAEATAEAWQDWLEDQFEGYEVDGVAVEESIAEQEVRVDWALAQRQEDVLGDEASLAPSRPLGPAKQAFTLPAERRLTPVQFAFADRDEVVLELSWPDGWEAQIVPEAASLGNEAGAFEARVEVDPAGRRLRYSRRFDTHRSELVGRDLYATLRELFAVAEKSDAQELVLLQP